MQVIHLGSYVLICTNIPYKRCINSSIAGVKYALYFVLFDTLTGYNLTQYCKQRARAVLASAQDTIRQSIPLIPAEITIQTEDTESVCDLCVGVKVFHAAPRSHHGREHAALCVFILSLRYKCVFVLAERIEGVLCGDCPSSVPVSYLRQ